MPNDNSKKFIVILFFIIFGLLVFFCIRINNYLKIKNKLFLTTKEYPQFKVLEDNWITIRDEIPDFDIKNITLERSQDIWLGNKMDEFAEKFKDEAYWFKAWADSETWYNFPIIYNNAFVGDVEKQCPMTCDILRQFNNIRIAGFSLLSPNGSIQIHSDKTGPTYNSMALNMLLNGEKSSLYVKPENKNFFKYSHKDGRAVIFNAEQEHFADNKNDKKRVILYIDFFT
jgi:beta-hydroxylase